VLSALAHGRDAKLAPGLFEAVVTSARGLDNKRRTLYVDLALSAFSGEVRSSLEAAMRNGTYEYQTQIAREFVAQGLEQGLERGLERGLKQGRQEGLKQGLEKGEQKGRLEGERRALFQVLAARGLKVEGAARRRLLSCTELTQLERWLNLAVKAQAGQQLLEHESPAKPVARATAPRSQARKPRARR
jgi:flagellar biosynthesis/type III secretory pathway protein FliH